MSCRLKSFKIFVIIILLAFAVPAKAQELTIFVYNWPPYNFQKNDRIVGICTELIEMALQRAKVRYKLVLYPFKRALITVQNRPNTMLYTVARIPQREDMFKWIGPLHPRKLHLYKLKNRSDIQINDVKDIKKYSTAVLLGGSVEQFFITHDFQKDHYYLVSNAQQLLKMLFRKRVDLIPGDPMDLRYQMKNLGYKYSLLESAYILSEEGGYYMIANKNTPEDIIARIQKSLEEIMASDIKDRIINKYIK